MSVNGIKNSQLRKKYQSYFFLLKYFKKKKLCFFLKQKSVGNIARQNLLRESSTCIVVTFDKIHFSLACLDPFSGPIPSNLMFNLVTTSSGNSLISYCVYKMQCYTG